MDVKILSIDTIGLSVRSTNALHRAEVHTVGDLLGYTEESLSQIRNLGKKSVEEIIRKIEEYKNKDVVDGLPDEIIRTEEFIAPENFAVWIQEESNRQMVSDYLKDNETRIEVLELLSTKAYNLLMFAGYDYLYEIAFLSEEKLMEIPRMDAASAAEIVRLVMRYVREIKEDIFSFISAKQVADSCKSPSIFEMIYMIEYRDVILRYVKANDIDIESMGLSNRSKNRLLLNGYIHLSDIVFMSRSELQRIPSMGNGSVEEVINRINEYLTENQGRMTAVISGDESAIWDDASIRKMILDQYIEIGFGGLSLNDFVERLNLPEQTMIGRLKGIIGQLIADHELEYVDYRCYRVYGKFEDYLADCTEINERSRDFIRKRLQGITLEAIARENGLTRERVRQIVKRDIEKVRNQYTSKTGMALFDEDYYRYLYETYAFEKKDGTEWLGIAPDVWNYLDLIDVKRGRKELQLALEDYHGLDEGLRLKIKNYLNRNKLYVDGMWIEKKRADLEQIVVTKFCTSDVSFDEFCHIYNEYLEQEEIPYDEGLYCTADVYRSRKSHLAEARFLLWKQNEQIRYYDIDGRDYTELLDVLNLDSYENIELSTLKFMREYPEIMEKYDIRDQYELHNLLRKIVQEGSYHDFHCGRMPMIKFGKFDRDAAILDILIDHAPVSMNDLAELISDEYGYDSLVVMSSYLQPFSVYYHQGMYSIDQKQMLDENKVILQRALTDDFYYIDEIRHIYSRLIPGVDVEEINPYNLKSMGFLVYSRYAVQNHASLEAFFHSLLTKEDIIDISVYRKRFVYVQIFSQKLMELKRELQVIEFEPSQIINFRKLEKSGITKDMIRDYCDKVYEFVSDGEYFSAQSLRQTGFETELYDLGFSDWFYANLLISDDRFSFATMFGNLLFYKGKESITIKSFEINRIREYGCVDSYDLLRELTERFGCKIADKWDIVYKVQYTEVYYDKILDRLYANKDLYDKEIEEGDF